MLVLAGEVVGVLAHVERADQHRTRGLEPFDESCIGAGRGALAIDLRVGQRRQARHVEQVLDRERHAGAAQMHKNAANVAEVLRATAAAQIT